MSTLNKILILSVIFLGANAFASWVPSTTDPEVIPDSVSKALNTGIESLPFKKGGVIIPSGKKFIVQNGNVGIGTTTPKAKLHVVGGLVIANNAQANKVLMSDQYGVGSWANAPAVMPSMASINAPTGAVMAFNFSNNIANQVHGDCPDGWSRFTDGDGRVVVGVGQLSGGGNYVLRQKGGEMKVQLTDAQIPAHYHEYYYKDGDHNDADEEGKGSNRVPNETNDATTPQQFVPHNNMMPYAGLTYCVKN